MNYSLLFNKIKKQYNLNKIQFAEKSNITRQTIDKLEKGQQKIGVDTICKLHVTFNVNPIYLLTGEGNMFINEDHAGLNIKKIMESTDLTEEQVIQEINNHFESPARYIFNVLTQASKGDKEAVSKLRKYLDAIEPLL